MKNQPTIDELSQLWTHALEAFGTPGAAGETKLAFYTVYMKKTTWIGRQELEFMFAAEAYFRHTGMKE